MAVAFLFTGLFGVAILAIITWFALSSPQPPTTVHEYVEQLHGMDPYFVYWVILNTLGSLVTTVLLLTLDSKSEVEKITTQRNVKFTAIGLVMVHLPYLYRFIASLQSDEGLNINLALLPLIIHASLLWSLLRKTSS